MKLAQICMRLSPDRQQSLLEHPIWSDAVRRGLAWGEAAMERQAVIDAADRLGGQAAALLRAALKAFGAAPVSEERLIREARKQTMLSGAECELALAQLEAAGILFAVSKVWGERLIFMPADCFMSWQQALFPAKAEPVSADDKALQDASEFHAASRPLGRQLLRALSAMAASGMELTAKGVLAKKTIAKLAQPVDFNDDQLRPFGFNWSHRDHYSITAAFILQAAESERLIATEEERVSWNEPQLAAWMNMDDQERERKLLKWCIELLLPGQPADSAHLISALCSLQAGRWYRSADISQLSEPFPEAAAGDEPGGSLDNWLVLLQRFGWLEFAISPGMNGRESVKFVRWKLKPMEESDGKAERVMEAFVPVAVQPNGEVIAEPGCSFAMHWELGLIGELITDDTAIVYRLTAGSIAGALEFGRSKASIRSFLERAGGCPLPQPVEAMLEEWTSRACRSWFEEVTLLRCDNEQMAQWMLSNGDVAPLLLHALGPADYIVDQASVPQLRRLLQKAGYPPQKAVRSSALPSVRAIYPMIDIDVAPATAADQRPHAYIYPAVQLDHYELVFKEEPPAVKAQHREADIPAMWTKQLRAYHPSTRRELVERALEWQSLLQLRMNSVLHSFVPERLEQQGGGWAVVGVLRDEDDGKPITLTPDMWDEMRIVVPGWPHP